MNFEQISRDALVAALLSPTAATGIDGDVGTAPIVRDGLPPRWRLKQADRDQLLRQRLSIARELLLRDLAAQMHRGPVLDSPSTLREWLRLRCAGLEHEVFLALFLDTHHRLLVAQELFRGTLTQTSVYPRELVKEALRHNAAALIVAHNHPSGQAEPSRADEYLTQSLKTALALVDVRLLDHFVVGCDAIVSFAERGMV
ncbi:RadC family protein [Sphaerotilus microaerophilus]|jgi:DNA repair protein RadC|uniref:RadC family protein n=1 Tax=Sphaerotilus microaerophilus TaxID=2914710 RepID=UPI0020747936